MPCAALRSRDGRVQGLRFTFYLQGTPSHTLFHSSSLPNLKRLKTEHL